MRKINENKNDKKRKAIINKIYEEMKYAEEYIKKWNLSLTESYSDIYSTDLYNIYKINPQKVYQLDKEYYGIYNLLEIYKYIQDKSKLEIDYGQPLKKITLYDEEENDYSCEFHQVKWITTSSSKIKRIFIFKSNGDITYSKNKSKSSTLSYHAKYNINSNELNLTFDSENDKIKIDFYNNIQYITYNNILIEINNVDGTKKISYIQNDINNQIITFEIIIDKSNKIINKYIIIKNYSQFNEIDSAYEFYYNKNNLTGALYFSKENKKYNMLEDIQLTNLAKNISSSINKDNIVFNENINELENLIIKTKKQIFKLIKSIKSDIPLYGLVKRLEIALSNLFTKTKQPEDEKNNQKINSKNNKNVKILKKKNDKRRNQKRQ